MFCNIIGGNILLSKIFYFILFLILINIIIPADETDNSKLNPLYLEQGNWQERNWGEISLRFFKNNNGENTFQYVINYEDDMPWVSDPGILNFQENVLSFIAIPGNDYSKISNDFFEQQGIIKISSTDFFYNTYLLLEPMAKRFWNLHAQVQEGEQRQIEETNVIIINRHGIANDNVSVRNGPSTKFNRFNLPLLNNQTYYPSGSRIFVYGRTEEKQRIEQWNAYWYLIHIPTHVMSSYSNANSIKKWVYGEFIDLDE